MNLLERYRQLIVSGEIIEEPQQLAVVEKLQAMGDSLMVEKNFFNLLKKTPTRGLYLWGSVGIGKTFLLDLFFFFLPFQEKWRTHFLPFMRDVHAQMRQLQGTKNPLQKIAKEWSKKTRVICFDEFAVNDIADALVLGGLLEALYREDVCVVFTSNSPPENLYKNGLQRELFLPTIALIQANNDTIHLTATDDYRSHYVRQLKYYWYPLTTAAQENMEKCFKQFAGDAAVSTAPLLILDREIPIKKQAERVVWFDFAVICGIPRNSEDYLAIAEQFSTVLISNLLPIRANENNWARCLIQLVDVFYERKIRLIISAALPVEEIYTAGQLLFEFARTQSRLAQMQSEEWVSGVGP